jgi:hypothetical protein
MRRLVLLAGLLFLFSVPAHSQTITTGGSDCSVSTNCVVVNTQADSGSVGFVISGTWTGTLNFEVSAGSGNFVSVSSFPPSSTTGVTSSSANGTWQASVSGMVTFRVRASAGFTGSAVVVIQVSRATAVASLSGGGGGGGGCSPSASAGQILYSPAGTDCGGTDFVYSLQGTTVPDSTSTFTFTDAYQVDWGWDASSDVPGWSIVDSTTGSVCEMALAPASTAQLTCNDAVTGAGAGAWSLEFDTNGGQARFLGATSGQLIVRPQAAAGTPVWTAGTSSGTPVVAAASPLTINSATGQIACNTCETTQQFAGGCALGVLSNLTNYCPVNGIASLSTTEATAQVAGLLAHDSTITSLFVQLSANVVAANTVVVTVDDNTSGTLATCTVAASTSTCSVTGLSVAVSAAHQLSIKVVGSTTAGTAAVATAIGYF